MSTTIIHTIEHEIGLDGVLEIRVGSGDVRLTGVDGTAVRVRAAHGDTLEGFVVDRGTGSLSIRSEPDHVGSPWIGRGGPDLAVEAPRNATLLVDSSSGGITADGFAGEQRYRSTSGDLRLRDVSGRLAVEEVSGDVDATVIGSASLAARTVSGDVAVRAATIRDLGVTTTSGDVRLAGELDGPGPFHIESVSGDAVLALAGDLRVDLRTVAGDLRSEIEGRAESRPGGRSISIGRAGPTLSIRTMSGDVRLVRPTPVVRDAPQTVVIVPDAEGPDAEGPGAEGPDGPDRTPDLGEAAEVARLEILRALERGELDVAEATRRLEALDVTDTKEATDA